MLGKPADTRILVRQILATGVVRFSNHAIAEMKKDNLESTDCVNVLRAGVYEAPELIDGSWRYRVTTRQICVVITILSDSQLRVITAWRVT